jgi:argininosuccinate synthase
MKKTVLAYSGGLDTSVAIKWLQEKYGVSVIAMAADVGEGKDLDFIQKKALKVGAEKAYIIDAKEEFVKNYIFPALKANALYEGIYPVSSSLSRPLISKLLVDIAEKEGADSVAHGCTGKGNDQVRFDVSVTALNPELKIIAPVREWPMSREEEIEYAKQNDIPVPVGKENPFSIDQNLWGRSIECGVLEDPWVEPPEEAYEWTVSIENAPEQPEYIEIDFEKGVPVKLNNKEMNGVDLISKLNKIAGQHGVGRIDHVENRLIGIKSREIYECPAATVLIKAHQSLEYLTLPKETLHFKHMIDVKYGELIYNGLWFSQLKEALDAFVNATQEHVTGKVKVKLHKGNCIVVGRTSPKSLYDVKLATYDEDDQFDHKASEGFIKIWGLPTKVYSMIKKA